MLAGMSKRVAAGGLVGFFAFWAAIGPTMLPRHGAILWPVFIVGALLAGGLCVMALLGKFDDPASSYVRALKLAGASALVGGVVFMAYSLWVIG